MSKKGHSERGFFGNINHYDEYGHKTGYSSPGFFGGYNNYDEHGHKTGHSDPGLFGGYNHYDAHGKKTGRSNPDLFGGYDHYDARGNKTGHSDRGLFGGYNHSSSEGCYIATCVYGSYDCPQVWSLRRFRDETLYKTWYGRAFIRIYYAVSPSLAEKFGHSEIFKKLCRGRLDRMVDKLQAKGVKSTPYKDKNRK